MVYIVTIPLSIAGLVHVTRTVLLFIAMTVVLLTGLGAVDDHHETLHITIHVG